MVSDIYAPGQVNDTNYMCERLELDGLQRLESNFRFDEEGNVSAQHIMAVNWSGDHRIIDGATMVRFNNLWMSYLTQPEKMLMHLR